MKLKRLGFPVFLLIYHLIFAVIAWQYNLQHKSDSYRYWHFTQNWKTYFHIGTDIIKLINYPFVRVLNLPFWTGFLIHSLIGFFAIYELYKFSLKYIIPNNSWVKYLLMVIFLLPNLHFWTSIIGKEPIVFLTITWILIKHSQRNYLSFKYILGWLLLVMIRPHVSMFLLISISLATVFYEKKLTLKKILIIVSMSISVLLMYLMTMQLLNRDPFDIAYILERNDASLIAFKRAGSYVPMISYNLFEKFFALNFRPLFADADSLFSFILSVENFLTLLILFYALYVYISSYKIIKFDVFARISLLFFVVSSLFFIQRYSCLGIFVRTKVMYLPFVMVVVLKIFSVSKSLSNEKVK